MSKKTLSAIAAFLVALGTLIGALVDSDPSPTTQTRTVQAQPDAVTPSEIQAAPPAGDLQGDPQVLRDTRPDDVPDQVLDAAARQEDKTAEQLDLPGPRTELPVAGAQGYSCRVDIQNGGYGGLRSQNVMGPKVHYTVSSNQPGWGDVLGVAGYLERAGLSATVIMDFEGHCLQTVPYNRNPYTQGAFNDTSESVEIIATGKETRAQWLAAPLIKDGILASWIRDRLQARGLPLRFVDPVGCTDKAGWSDHNHLECDNNHFDVSPVCAFNNAINGHALYPAFVPKGCSGFPFDVVRRQVSAGVKPNPRKYLFKGERAAVRCLEDARRRIHKAGGWKKAPSYQRRRAARCRGDLIEARARIKRNARKTGIRKYHRGARLGVIKRVLGPKYAK